MPFSKDYVLLQLEIAAGGLLWEATTERSVASILAVEGTPRFIKEAYVHFLGREPDPPGFETHLAFLESGGARLEFLKNLRASDEGQRNPERRCQSFDELLGIEDNDAFVSAAYRNFLWRAPDNEGRAHFLKQLSKGKPRAWVLYVIATSPESESLGGQVPAAWKPKTFDQLLGLPNEEFLPAAYRTLLWREPDDAGLASFSAALDNRAHRSEVLSQIGASVEARNLLDDSPSQPESSLTTFDELLGIPGDREFLHSAYRTYLARDPDDGGLEAFTGLLARPTPRARVLYQIASSAEARQHGTKLPAEWLPRTIDELLTETEDRFVRAAYRTILWRNPSSSTELTYKMHLGCGRPRGEIIRELANSGEAAQLDLPRVSTDRLPEAPLLQRWIWRVRRAIFGGALRHNLELGDQLKSNARATMERLTAETREDLRVTAERLSAQILSLRSTDEQLAATMSAIAATQRDVTKISSMLQRHTEWMAKGAEDRQAQQRRVSEALAQSIATTTQAVLINRSMLRDRLPFDDVRAPAITLADNLVVTRLDDSLFAIPAEDVRLAAYLTLRGHLEKGLHAFLDELVKPGMHIVDAGAHIGLHSIPFGRKVGPQGKVYCFEPSPRIFQILNLNAAINNLESHLITSDIALGDGPGTAAFFVRQTYGHSSLFDNGAQRYSLEVRRESLDDLLPRERKIDLIKIDVEGAEALVLRGLTRTIGNNPDIRIVVEFAPSLLRQAGCAPENFLSEIDAMGFTIDKVDDYSGELLPGVADELLNSLSSNLYLTKRTGRKRQIG